MKPAAATLAAITAMDEAGIPYVLLDPFSNNFYGSLRATNDADFVIRPGAHPIAALATRLGDRFRLAPQTPPENAAITLRHILYVVGTSFKVELFHLSDDPHDQMRFPRRRSGRRFDRDVFLPTAEVVIVTKLRWAAGARRSKDWDDARDVIAVQGDRIDWDYVHGWADRH